MPSEQFFTFPCPNCGEEQEAETQWRGLKGECYACEKSFIIPLSPSPNKSIQVVKGQAKRSYFPPPLYNPNFTDTLLDIVSGGRYVRARRAEGDRARVHLKHLLEGAKNRKQEFQSTRVLLDKQRMTAWNDLKQISIADALIKLKVDSFKSLSGVGPGTIQKLKDARLYTAQDVVRRPDLLNQIPRVPVNVCSDILRACEECKRSAERSFYPVFTNKSDHSEEMRLLGLYLAVEKIDKQIREVDSEIQVILNAVKAMPVYGVLDRIRERPSHQLTTSEGEYYSQAVVSSRVITETQIHDRVETTLSQDQYIRAIGLLENVHPRPLTKNLERGRGTNRGNPLLQSLDGFNKSERERNQWLREENDLQTSRKYQRADSLHSIAGDRVLQILRFPRDEQLVQKIEETRLCDALMENIILRNYQKFGTKFMVSRKRVVIGDEMGLGKTIQALALIAHLNEIARQENKVVRSIVVCPASIRVNWEREIKRFTSFPVYPVQGRRGMGELWKWQEEGGIIVMSYESLRSFPFRSVTLDVCIVDEAQYIKNPSAQRTKHCREVLKNSEYAICMTGTPIENNLEEFLSIFEATKIGVGDEIRALLLESDDPERFAAMVQSLYLRRNKQDVLVELPALNLVHEAVELSQEEIELHIDHIRDDCVHFMRLRQNLNDLDISGASKIRRVLTLIDEYTENRRSVIVFTFFREPIEWLQNRIEDAFIIHGGIPAGQRQTTIDRFSEELPEGQRGRVLVSQIQSGGIGLNIQAASAVILLEPQFNPAIEVQAISRVHRMGQRNSVDVHRMICMDTIEEILTERLSQKQEIMDLYAGDSHLKNLTPNAVDIGTDDEIQLRRLVLLKNEESKRRAG